MVATIAPLAASVLIWWVSTCVLLWLIHRRAPVRFVAAGALTALGMAATYLLYTLRDDVSAIGAYMGFATGIALWAWHEGMFLFGYISGARKTDCPPDVTGWARFKVSAETVMHHELLIALHAMAILALSVGAGNQVAAATFLLLWAMRVSSKLVIFLGAPNVAAHFLPEHLRYLTSYFKTSRVTPWFGVFALMVTVTAGGLLYQGLAMPAGSFAAIGYLLLAGLACLAVFEHVALVMPMPDGALWSWAHPGQKNKKDKDNLDYGRL